MKFQQKDTLEHYSYLEGVLIYIRALTPNDVMGEILENLYKVSLKKFCGAL